MNQTFLILTILGMVFFGSIYGGLKGKIGNGVLVFKALATLMPVLAAFAGVRANNSMSGWLMVGEQFFAWWQTCCLSWSFWQAWLCLH